ncbi:hypothetical protein ENSA5_45080 [Enhygromyxa salina]|uniref:Lipoprotein n=1 Tax=Enhygromyxa salina TaxID=215803 RepID=A0A2S9XJV8_9BACT|nr:hypothetical protein [Enhygromyxa salina]PRP93133.1 hypothetical protein ENSA5_45080 [Enhygromyxa salina]
MTKRLLLVSSFSLTLAAGCTGEAHEAGHQRAVEVEPGLGPRAQPPPPEPTPTPVAEPPEPTPAPEPEPELSERKQALANVGRAAFDALESGEFDALLALTPLVDDFLRDRCADLPVADRKELEARFNHCHQAIAWTSVAEAQVFAGEPSGEPAIGCDAAIEDYGRLQLFVHMNDATIWRFDFFGAVGQAGNAIGINGEVSCREVDEAPALK